MKMLFAPDRKHTYGPPLPVTGIAILSFTKIKMWGWGGGVDLTHYFSPKNVDVSEETHEPETQLRHFSHLLKLRITVQRHIEVLAATERNRTHEASQH
jgi:hypothetical protein